MTRKSASYLFLGMLALYFAYIIYQISQSAYAHSDDAWTLWHNPEPGVMLWYWGGMGRIFAGYVQQKLFSLVGVLENLKYIRLLGCLGWMSCTALFYGLLNRSRLFDYWTTLLCVACFASSFFLLILVGWTAQVLSFIPALLCLGAAPFLYERKYIPLVLLMGITSLFFYQVFYPYLLLPFYFSYLKNKDGKFTKPMLTGLFYFFLGLVIYFVLWKLIIYEAGQHSHPRTAVEFHPLEKLGFFFSPPMNQAFNVNFFFNTGSPVSQAVFPVLFTAWLAFEFLYRKNPWPVRIRYVLGLIVWWMIGYLPCLIAKEDFGPYRSMAVLGPMVFVMMADIFATLVKGDALKQRLTFLLTILLLVWGDYVYYAYLSHPLTEEYKAVRKEVTNRYTPGITKIVFVRADEEGFLPHFGVHHYKDEFGMPSTYKDWTPEPLVKQIVYEMTGSREKADRLQVVLYQKSDEIHDKKELADPNTLFIDAHTLF